VIRTSEVRHFACVWFVPGSTYDFQGVLYQKHDSRWELQYRFRYYHPDSKGDPFDDKDLKNEYLVTFHEGTKVAEMEAKMDEVIASIFSKDLLKKVEKVEIRGDAKKFLEVMSKQPWVHMKFEDAEENSKAQT
jgi:hypothetical protein